MIKVTNLSFGFPQKDLYNEVCFEIEDREHAVLIGSNGTGKSTLVDMLMDNDKYMYEGKIEMDQDLRIGYVSQFVKHEGQAVSAYDFLAQPFVDMLKESDELCGQMDGAEDMEAVYEEYQKCLDQIEAVDGYNYDVNIRKDIATAGLGQLMDIPVNLISGGEYKLLSIIRNMLLKPQLLIMDEPDVFLDFENLVGLSKLINSYEGTVLVITHNRLLLSQCFDKILHLENQELQEFPGTFAEYNYAMLETKINMQEQAKKDADWIAIQEKLVDKMRAEATRIANSGLGKQLKARVSYLERLQARKTRNPFIEDHGYDFTFPFSGEAEESTTDMSPVVSLDNYSLSFDRELLSGVTFTVNSGDKLAIVGPNGTGKSSMLKDIYGMLKDREGLAYFSQIYDSSEENAMSGGERNIACLKEIASKPTDVLLLDEPTSHLDTYAQLALEKAIDQYPGTVIMVSHDFYTVVNLADRIIIIENGTAREMSGRAYRKSIYKKYFDSDIFEQERLRKEKEVKINGLLKAGKYEAAKEILVK